MARPSLRVVLLMVVGRVGRGLMGLFSSAVKIEEKVSMKMKQKRERMKKSNTLAVTKIIFFPPELARRCG